MPPKRHHQKNENSGLPLQAQAEYGSKRKDKPEHIFRGSYKEKNIKKE